MGTSDQHLRPPAPELSVIVPSFNEIDNVAPLLERLNVALAGIDWEVIYVDDDSPDGTAEKVRQLSQADSRIRCVHRIGRRGLSTAVIEGMLASSGPYLAVMDADLQHDEKLLPKMLEIIKLDRLDVVIASRYAPGGEVGEWSKRRVATSKIATAVARKVICAELTDPMSGFFVLTRPAFEGAMRQLSGQGFKILVDLFASTPQPYRFRELPYKFSNRIHGTSKLDSLIVWQYFMLLLDKLVGRWLPVRFVVFAAIGGSGVIVHLLALRGALAFLSFPFSQAVALVCAMTTNFTLNNLLTYRDQRLHGWGFIVGLASFYAIGSIGAAANVGIALAAFGQHYSWWVSGLAGSAVGVVWNYAISAMITWKRWPDRPPRSPVIAQDR